MDQASSLRKLVTDKAAQMKQQAVAQAFYGAHVQEGPRVISVTSGKGGVGKTNLVGSMAIAMRQLGQRVMILDADLGLANIDIIFGIHPQFNIGHVINGEKPLSDVIVNGPEDIKIIPAGSGFTSLTHLTEGQKLNLLSEFEALDDLIDVMLIDTGAGISSNVIYFNLAADECLVITTPEPTSITDAYAVMKVLHTEHNLKHFLLLVNMVHSELEAKQVYLNLLQVADRFLGGIVIEYVGYIPGDESVPLAVKQRHTFFSLYPNAAASQKIRSVASILLEAPRRLDAKGNIKFFFRRYLDFCS